MSRIKQDAAAAHGTLTLNRTRLLGLFDELAAQPQLARLRRDVAAVKAYLAAPNGDARRLLAVGAGEEGVSLGRDFLAGELDQILAARTLERARYYLRRLRRGVAEVRTGGVNDINLLRWKEYSEVVTDSLWLMPKRDDAGAHAGWYWGNFIPQIPRQLLLRYTRRGDWVLDTFLGSGTTLIECRRLGRNGVGIELNPEVAREAAARIRQEANPHGVTTKVIVGDAREVDPRRALRRQGVGQTQMVIMHPPYHDIIRFSDNEADLSGASSVDDFLEMFGAALDNATRLLERGRYLAVVIGDKYAKGEWEPLGFRCMNEALARGYALKSIVVKNFDETRAKRDQKQLWRYRALVGGFYVFKHEYILLFRKP